MQDTKGDQQKDRRADRVVILLLLRILKFALGLWLALLLNQNLPFKSFFRAVVLLPWVVPTVLSALAFWWIYDSQFSILSWSLIRLGVIDGPINFLGDANNARASVIAASPTFSTSIVGCRSFHTGTASRPSGAQYRKACGSYSASELPPLR